MMTLSFLKGWILFEHIIQYKLLIFYWNLRCYLGEQCKSSKCRSWYLVPAIVIPDERHVVCNMEWTIFIKQCQFTATSWPSCQPYDNRLILALTWFKEKVEHPANDLIYFLFLKKKKKKKMSVLPASTTYNYVGKRALNYLCFLENSCINIPCRISTWSSINCMTIQIIRDGKNRYAIKMMHAIFRTVFLLCRRSLINLM